MVPAFDVTVYAVTQRAAVVRLAAAVSVLTRPAYDGVIAGTGSPYVTVGLDAVIMSGCRWIVIEPAT